MTDNSKKIYIGLTSEQTELSRKKHGSNKMTKKKSKSVFVFKHPVSADHLHGSGHFLRSVHR